MEKKCRITVLMSVYNGERYLREAIESILNQTYKEFEFVIYDDCSTDHTPEIIKSYPDSRIVYRRNSVNQGLTRNLADGVSRSEADYIARMDADDIAYPERLARQLEWMDRHPEVTILGSPVTYFKDTLGDLGISKQPTDDVTIKATLFISFTLMHPSIIIRREDLVKHGLNYNPEYRCSQDHVLYLDCIRKGLKFANTEEPLLHMRAHGGSISRAKHGIQQECSQRARLHFLQTTGIADGCTDEEIAVYNTFASGEYPDSVHKVHVFEHFVEKVYNNPITLKYFDRDCLRKLMADRLCGGAYHAIDNKLLKKSALAARRSWLKKYSTKWPCNHKIKFIVKVIISALSRR